MADKHVAIDLAHVRAAVEEAGNPWVAGDTSMTRLTEAQRRARLGVPVPPKTELEELQRRAKAVAARPEARAAAAGAPSRFDARDVGGKSYVTGVKDQGSCGSCVAFGSCATMETTAAFTQGQPDLGLDLSEAHLFYTHGGAAGVTCDTGWLPSPALDYCRDVGVTNESLFPYTPGNSGGATLDADWPNHLAKVTSHTDLTNDVPAMKEWISTHGAVAACFFVYPDFYSLTTGVYRHLTGDNPGGHCVAIIGYDDAAGCWIAKNSWNAGWGDHGFFRIAYGECAIETWSVQGVAGVTVRSWLNDTRVIGLWTDQSAGNAWAYLRNAGWRRLAGTTEQANLTMLQDATSARLGNRRVNAFDAGGTISELYVF